MKYRYLPYAQIKKQKKAKLREAEGLLYQDFSPSVTASPRHLPRQREENKVFQQTKLSPIRDSFFYISVLFPFAMRRYTSTPAPLKSMVTAYTSTAAR